MSVILSKTSCVVIVSSILHSQFSSVMVCAVDKSTSELKVKFFNNFYDNSPELTESKWQAMYSMLSFNFSNASSLLPQFQYGRQLVLQQQDQPTSPHI